ncbi:MAG: hypothetical protein RIT43_1607 [Bacteroidota bacterium]
MGKILKIYLLIGACFALKTTSLAQQDKSFELPKIRVWKAGPYFGVQRGKYWVGEIGGEVQWKKIQLKKSQTHAAHTGVNYNFIHNVLGYDLGYWIKPSRIGLTYGANLIFRTDFNRTGAGFAPCLGYKIFGFHLQAGYQFLTRSVSFDGANTFFIGLRFVAINHRDTKLKK